MKIICFILWFYFLTATYGRNPGMGFLLYLIVFLAGVYIINKIHTKWKS